MSPRPRRLRSGTAAPGRPPDDRRPPWLPRLPSEWYFAFAAACYVAACFLLTRWLMTRSRRLLAVAVAATLAAVGLTALVVRAGGAEREERDRRWRS